MPYIPERDRAAVEPRIFEKAKTAGELNYQITRLLVKWVGFDMNYERLNAAVGALECAKLELYRRVAAPYEDKKKRLNGDVY